jgi:hypothetical protein
MKTSSTRKTSGKDRRTPATRRGASTREVATIIAACWDGGGSAARDALEEPWRNAWLSRWIAQDDSLLCEEVHCRLARRLSAAGHPGVAIVGGQHWLTLGAITESVRHDLGFVRVLRGWASDRFVERGSVGQRVPGPMRRRATWQREPIPLPEIAAMVLGMDDIAQRLAASLIEESARLARLLPDKRLAALAHRRRLAARRRSQRAKATPCPDHVATVTALPVALKRQRAA